MEQAAATGVEAALAKGRSADHKSALAKAEKVQGNTQLLWTRPSTWPPRGGRSWRR